jgi:hypothetical protein
MKIKMFDKIEKIADLGVYIEDCATEEKLKELIEDAKSFEKQELRFGTRYTVHSFRSSHANCFKDTREIMTEGITKYLEMTGRSIDDYKPANDYYAYVAWNEKSVGTHRQSIDYEGNLLVLPDICAFFYLTDGYEGGETTFIDANVSVSPKAGSMLIYEADSLISISSATPAGVKIEVGMPMYLASKNLDGVDPTPKEAQHQI